MSGPADECAALQQLDSAVTAARGVPVDVAPEPEPAPSRHAAGSALTVTAALATTLLLWASAFVGIRYAVREYDPGALALFRNLITAAALFAVGAFWRPKALQRPAAGDLARIVVAGVIGIALYQVSLISGEQSVDAGTASLIINTSPIFTAVFALLILQERLGLRGWVGVFLGFFGAALLVTSHHGEARFGVGALWVLTAAVAQAVSFVIQKPLLLRLGPFAVTAWVGLFGALSVLPWAGTMLHDIGRASALATAAAVYLGLFPAAIGNLTWAYALTHLPAGRASTALYLVAPIALLISWLLLREQPALQALVGGGVVISSVALVNLRRRPTVRS